MGKAADSGRFWLTSAALNGFMAVAMGAIAAHALKNRLAPEALEWVRTGSTYQMWHALALLALALMPGTAAVASRRIAGRSFDVHPAASGARRAAIRSRSKEGDRSAQRAWWQEVIGASAL